MLLQETSGPGCKIQQTAGLMFVELWFGEVTCCDANGLAVWIVDNIERDEVICPSDSGVGGERETEEGQIWKDNWRA